MVAATRPPRNAFVRTVRRIYNPLGFAKGYNFILYFIFAGALFGFTLARFMYLHWNTFCPADRKGNGGNSAAPGECYWYNNFNQYKIGIQLHLGTILPASILVCVQFTPAVRHKWLLIHRINGYIVLLLFLLSMTGALMIARHAFGGSIETTAGIGVLFVMSTGSFVISYINIKRLQIEQHRAFMLRGWFYAGSIITLRIIMIIAATIASTMKSYYTARPCVEIAYTLNDDAQTLRSYPECVSYFNGTNPGQEAVVQANMQGSDSMQAGAALGISFGMALWVAFWLHAVGVEIYLHLTPKEADRLRKVSYQKQLEAGMKNPGRAGLTADRLGDAELWEYRDYANERKISAQSASTASTSDVLPRPAPAK